MHLPPRAALPVLVGLVLLMVGAGVLLATGGRQPGGAAGLAESSKAADRSLGTPSTTPPSSGTEPGSTTPPSTSPPSASTTSSEPPQVVRGVELFVSVGGVDKPNGGWTADDPLATPSYAVQVSMPGDTIRIAGGTYESFAVVDLADLSVVAVAGEQVRFVGGSYSAGVGISIENSSGIELSGLSVMEYRVGVRVLNSTNVMLQGLLVSDIGQEAIHVEQLSSDIVIRDNVIEGTGKRPGSNGEFTYATFGEGIYLGTGGLLANGVRDATTRVLIEGNEISNTTGEAIDVKASVTNVTIRNNRIHDIDVATGGAIAVGRGTRTYDADVLIEGNALWNISTWSSFSDGNALRISSSAVIRGNVIWGTQHRGVLVEEDLRVSSSAGVVIECNAIFETGFEEIVVAYTGAEASVSLGQNLLGDEAIDSLGLSGGSVANADLDAVLAALAPGATACPQ